MRIEEKIDNYLMLTEKTNKEVIDMFIGDSFPKDKMPTWGTKNLKINKEKNGWSMVNYTTPLLYRDKSGTIYLNTDKYSPTTSKLQNLIKSELRGMDYKTTDESGIRKAIG